ncbi:MAG: hypothetical protein IT368_11780 [Candidatus Hydrogenedentes bacterium]|nr:hypothetical protein [Candidatus Hydrogenedentota bacterium]
MSDAEQKPAPRKKKTPRPKGPVCPGCGKALPAGRGVCPECGYMTGWFRTRIYVGCLAVALGFLGILTMIYLMFTAPPMPPQ